MGTRPHSLALIYCIRQFHERHIHIVASESEYHSCCHREKNRKPLRLVLDGHAGDTVLTVASNSATTIELRRRQEDLWKNGMLQSTNY
mmetsp:Transcript_16962/g.19359  ORF Transcript_16962/g.19359 Transcript_16962/m.19359 type:complete len:88 (+) Transcript_16962:137-400(+)